MQKRHYRSEASKERSLSRRGLENLVAHLTNVVAGLPSPRPRSQWLDYADIHSYTQETIAAKRAAVERFVHALSPRRVLDIGANTGEFSMLAASHAGFVVATDADPDCVDEAYRRCRQAGIRNVLPLVVDITNPSPVGWAGRERKSFLDRARVDVVIALAIVHHLAIGASIPLRLISEYFAQLGKFAIVEFVPPDDPQAGRIARGKSGLHHEYSQEALKSAMQSCFELVESQDLAPGGRQLYLLRSRLFEETGDDQVSSL